jgi:alanyl-tRNA synthetase
LDILSRPCLLIYPHSLTLSLTPHPQVGVDSKAVADAWSRIEKKHGDKLAALFVSVDEQKGKALAFAGVPVATSDKLKANEWVNSALTLLGGKGGGKPTLAQGQGADFSKAADALAAAEQFAAMKL